MKKQLTWLMAAMMAMLIVGCANQKAPAEQAVAGAESALSAIRDTAAEVRAGPAGSGRCPAREPQGRTRQG